MKMTDTMHLIKQAKLSLMKKSSKEKNDLLLEIARSLIQNCDEILLANRKDMDLAKENGLSEAFKDRLLLTKDRISQIASSLENVVTLPDPVGRVTDSFVTKDKLTIHKISIPIGIIGIIFESRPNVSVDCAALCLKSSNAVILKGGKEAQNSTKALIDVVRSELKKQGFDENCVTLLEPKRSETAALLENMDVDLIIPRGGKGLIDFVRENAKVPVIETGVGNCHIFVDESADINIALAIIQNAKMSRPSVCNAVETVLVHEKIAKDFLPQMQKTLKGVTLLGCEKTCHILENVSPATGEDYATEFNDLILAVKVVENIDEAIEHIQKYSTNHSESIITQNKENQDLFTLSLESSAVYVNASTRFTDGGCFGLGCEIGISTGKLHARGPMGLKELTTYKYIIEGTGQVRE